MKNNKESANWQLRNYCIKQQSKLDKLIKQASVAISNKLEGIVLVPNSTSFEHQAGKHHISDLASLLLLTNKPLHIEDRQKLISAIESTIEKENINLNFFVWDLEQLWDKFCDQPAELSFSISRGYPLLNSRFIDSIMLSTKLKSIILDHFEDYVLAICISGSFARLTFTTQSDFDLFLVIDDTSVKKLTNDVLESKITSVFNAHINELKTYHIQAHKINLQTYLLTEFWLSIKNHSSVVHTLLRDGVPLYDKGIFVVWKNMLNRGLLKPSAAACDIFVNDSEERLLCLEKKINALVVEDIYWILIQYAQAILMINGISALTDRETIALLSSDNMIHGLKIKSTCLSYLEQLIEARKGYEREQINELSVNDLKSHFRQFEDARFELQEVYERQKESIFRKQLNNQLQILQTRLKTVANDLLCAIEQKDQALKENLYAFLYNYLIDGQSIMHHINQIRNMLSISPGHDLPATHFEHAFNCLGKKMKDVENIFSQNTTGEKACIEHKNDMYLLHIPLEKKIIDLHIIQNPEGE